MIKEELEMLETILMGDMHYTYNEDNYTLTLRIPNQHHLNILINILVENSYPFKAPEIFIAQCPILSSDELHNAIKVAIKEFQPSQQSIYAMYNAIKEYISSKIDEAIKLKEEQKRREQEVTIASQEKIVKGVTAVTSESYKEWRKKFDNEFKFEEKESSLLTGKQIFMMKKEIKIEEDKDELDIDFDAVAKEGEKEDAKEIKV